MMITLTIIALCIFIGYIVYIFARFGVIQSISDSYYQLERKEKTTGLYFTVWCALVTTITLPPSMAVCEAWWQSILAIVMCLGLLFVGASPAFHKENHNVYHLTGALLSAGCAITLSILWGYWYIMALSAILSLVVQLCTPKKDITLWLEVACFLAYYIALILCTL